MKGNSRNTQTKSRAQHSLGAEGSEPRAASPTLEDPEASRARGLPVGIDSTAAIQVTVTWDQALDLQRESTETAHREGWGSVQIQLLIKQLLRGFFCYQKGSKKALFDCLCVISGLGMCRTVE